MNPRSVHAMGEEISFLSPVDGPRFVTALAAVRRARLVGGSGSFECDEHDDCPGHPEENPKLWPIPHSVMPDDDDSYKARLAQSSDMDWLWAQTGMRNVSFLLVAEYMGTALWLFPSDQIATLVWKDQVKQVNELMN